MGASGKIVRYKLQVVYLPPREGDSDGGEGGGGGAKKGIDKGKPMPREVPESVWGSVLLPADTTVRAIRALLQQNRAAFGYPLTHGGKSTAGSGDDGAKVGVLHSGGGSGVPTTVWLYSDTHSASRLRDDCVLADRLVLKRRNTAVLYVL